LDRRATCEVERGAAGGTFRNNLLKLVDPETGKLLPLSFAKVRLPDLPTKEVIHVGTDKRGWPIPADW
jgi:hypothetical protein